MGLLLVLLPPVRPASCVLLIWRPASTGASTAFLFRPSPITRLCVRQGEAQTAAAPISQEPPAGPSLGCVQSQQIDTDTHKDKPVRQQ